LGGSYYVEWLTDKLEDEANKVMAEVERMGGCTKCMENGWWWQLLDRQIQEYRKEIDEGKRILVGVNKFRKEEALPVPAFAVDQARAERVAVERIKRWKADRDQGKVKEALKGVEEAARAYESVEQAGKLMPALVEAARAKCTIGEMTAVLFDVYGVAFPY